MNATAVLPRIHVGAPSQRGGLTLFPLWTEHPEPPASFVTGDAATDLIAISEMPTPTVPQLALTSMADVPVLVVQGELVAGGMQHRVLNVTVLAPPAAQLTVPVSCVEAGRWSGAADNRLAGRHSSPTVRGRSAAADQGAVWDAVAQHAARTHTGSVTQSFVDVENATRETVGSLTGDLAPLPGQRGVIAGIGGRVVGLELFSSTKAFEAHFRRLIEGYAADAIGTPSVATSSSTARAFVRAAAKLPWTQKPAVGLGTELSAHDGTLTATGLRVDGTPVHLAVFAA